MLIQSSSEYTDEGSIFLSNVALRGGAIYMDKAIAFLTETKFESNYAYDGGAIYLSGESTLSEGESLNFTENYASNKGGALNIQSSSQFSLSNGVFLRNSGYEGSALYILGVETDNQVTGTTFIENTATDSNTIAVMFSTLTISGITMQDNTAAYNTHGVFVTFSTVDISGCTFNNSQFGGYQDISTAGGYTSVTGGAVMISVGATVTISSTTIDYSYASSGGAVYMSGNSGLEIDGLTVSNCYSANDGGGIYLQNYNEAKLQNCEFSGNIAGNQGSDILSSEGNLNLQTSTFTVKASTSSSVYVSGNTFTAESLTFTIESSSSPAKSNSYGGAIYTYNCDSVSLWSSTFEGLDYSIAGGAVAMTMDTSQKGESIPDSPSHIIANVTFTSNEANAGGALYVLGIDYLKITNTTFNSNSAITSEGISQSGYGGAIVFDTSDEIVKLELDSSVFFNSNSAKAAGGAIYWNYVEPDNIDSPTFTDNTASSYGDNAACFAQQLIQVTESEYNSAQGRRVLSDYSGTNSLSLSDQASGGELPDLYLSLVDQYGQNIGTDETSTATLKINTTGTTSDYTPVLSGTTTVAASNGMFMFTGVTFTAEPGATFNLYITTTGIDISKPSNEEYWENVSKASASVDLKVSLRE